MDRKGRQKGEGEGNGNGRLRSCDNALYKFTLYLLTHFSTDLVIVCGVGAHLSQ